MRKKLLLLLALLLLLQGSFASGDAGLALRRSSHRQASEDSRAWEKLFLNVPNPDSARRHLRVYTEEPHMAGTEQDHQTALYTRDRMREYGINANIVEYYVWLPYPKEISVEMIAPTPFKATLVEEGVPEDKDSYDTHATPIFNAYSASADVTAQLVYVNYGVPADYKKLDEMGVSVKGKIALARYGHAFRGVKAKVAEQHGAAGLLIYSDPADDGYGQGDIYPRGPYRSASSAQRGSVIYTFQYAGDPLTPGVAATKDAKRLTPDQAESLPRIPVQPLSYKDAAPLLEALGGPNVPRGWQGSLAFPYHIGPGAAEVRLKVDCDYQIRKIWDVIGEIKGASDPQQLVIIGNHRDAWVYGAVDPNSGSASMLEIARGFGELLKQGWKPARTILMGSWDAEEFGLIGSTEWVEDNADLLSKHAVAYINVDVAVNGLNFSIAGVPSLTAFAHSAMSEIIDPKTGHSVLEAWAQRQRNERPELAKRADTDLQIGYLGSGSDFTPFLQHIGVPSLDMGFNGPYGVYHSKYDSFHWMEKFGDPTFSYHVALAKLWGLMTMRLASLSVLPFEYGNYGEQIEKYLDDIEKSAKETSFEIDLKDVRRAAGEFHQAADRYSQMIARAHPTGAALKSINETLFRVERAFIDPGGLPLRPWYRHVVYAPGYYAGYDAEIFSGLQQAINEKDNARARAATAQIVAALERAKNALLLTATP
jgi:N-acetylated-alpha-linked acidic dipeptidase